MRSENKAIAEHYLSLINKETGARLYLSHRYNYYVIDQETEAGGCENIASGLTLAEAKSWAVSVYSFLNTIRRS